MDVKMTVLNHDLMDENELIYQFQHNYLKRNETFSLLMKPYWAALYSRCLYKVKDKESIDDVLQDVLLKIYQGLPKYYNNGVFKTWIYKIADNVCYSYLRSNMKYMRGNIPIDILELAASVHSVNVEHEIDVGSVVSDLPYKEQEIIDLRFYQDLTLLEISDILCITISACKMRLYRALKSLSHLLFGYRCH